MEDIASMLGLPIASKHVGLVKGLNGGHEGRLANPSGASQLQLLVEPDYVYEVPDCSFVRHYQVSMGQ